MSSTRSPGSQISADDARRDLIGRIAGSVVLAAARRESTPAPAQASQAAAPATGELARPSPANVDDASVFDSLADVLDPPDSRGTESLSSAKPCLSNKQLQVLEFLATGVNIAQAARCAGVSRMTIHRWITGDPFVRAAYNRWRQLARDSARNRLLALQNIAADVVFDRIAEKRDPKLAMRLLERLGALAPDTPGATDPKLAALEAEVESLRQQVRLRQENIKLNEEGFKAQRDEGFISVRKSL